MRYVSNSVFDTEELGATLGGILTDPAVVALRGALGAGKTSFARGLARGLGIRDHVTSPTFALVHEHTGRLPMFHFDLYRLDGPHSLFYIGWDDYLERGGVCVVEWSERVGDELPPNAITVTLEADSENPDRRVIVIEVCELLP